MREALKLALDELIRASSYCNTYDAIDAVKEALAQPEQEPVGFIEAKADNECADAYADGWNACVHAHKDTTPPKRPWGKPWVSLTDEEIYAASKETHFEQKPVAAFARAIEAKLREKNGGGV